MVTGFDGRVAIVTGAGGGIGGAVAQAPAGTGVAGGIGDRSADGPRDADRPPAIYCGIVDTGLSTYCCL